MTESSKQIFTGSIYIFQAYDVGDDLNLEEIKEKQLLLRRPLQLSKYFKNYHIPLEIDLPHPHTSSRIVSARLHSFGVISLAYRIPFSQTLEDLREEINAIDDEYNEQSVVDAGSIFNKIKSEIKQPKFFHLRKTYMIVQVDPVKGTDIEVLKEKFGSTIASILRYETVSLSEIQKNEILDSSVGYYKESLIVVDTQAAFVYEVDYEELLDLFEFANMQSLELQYFDRTLAQQLNVVYERGIQKVPFQYFLPFMSGMTSDPITALGKLKVDISVITERLENSIKLAGEEFYSEIFALLIEKLDIRNWHASINRKLSIIFDLRSVYEKKVDNIREDLLSVLIIILIFIELVVGILHLFK